MNDLSNYIDTVSKALDKNNELSESEKFELLKGAKIIILRKGDFLFTAGEEIKYSYVVLDGLFRTFFTYKNKEVTTYFYSNLDVIADYSAINSFENANYSLQAIKNSKVIAFPIENSRDLLKTSLTYQQHYIKRLNKAYKVKALREVSLMALTGEERLKEFKSAYPDFFAMVPDIYIASYMGITPVQLSRLINKKLNPNDNMDQDSEIIT